MVTKKTILIFLVLLVVEQLTKIVINLTQASFDIHIFAINLVQNTGAIWGFFKDSNMTFIWISIIVIGVLIYFNDQVPTKGWVFYLMIFTGIVGNLMDRIFLGHVTDFLDFKIWPVFNFADAYISIGVIGLIIVFMWKEYQLKSSNSSNLSK